MALSERVREAARATPHRSIPHSLLRPRLLLPLNELLKEGAATIVAPAGSGKTTLLTQWAQRCEHPVAWYSAEAGATSGATLLTHLADCLTTALGTDVRGRSIDALMKSLEAWEGERAVLVVDDAHALRGTDAESVLGQLLRARPPRLSFLIASRRVPDLGLSRLLLDESLFELGVEDLRFRTWETESLFRQEYGVLILPEEAAVLTRRTDGWAAGLQLFHLAVRDKSRAERAGMLQHFDGNFRTVGNYLADNVMRELPDLTADFLIRSSPLGVLTSELCDRFLERSDSAAILRSLELRGLFVTSVDEGRTYRYHEILRSYLDGLLTAKVGEAETRALHYRASCLLRQASSSAQSPGASTAVLRALCRAGSWEEAASLLASHGGATVGVTDDLMAGIPDEFIESDPCLQLAMARRHVAAGNLPAALATYRGCEHLLPREIAAVSRTELMAIANWNNPIPSPAPGWIYALRRAVAGNPLAEVSPTPTGDLQELTFAGLANLLAGQVARSRAYLELAAARVTDPVWDLSIRIALTAASLLAESDPDEREEIARRCLPLSAEADRLGMPALARLSFCLLALAGQVEMATEARRQCHEVGDRWGELLAGILEGAGRLQGGEDPVDLLHATSGLARELGAGTLEAMALAELAAAQAVTDDPEARQAAISAEAFARRAGVPGAQALSHFILARLGEHRGAHRRRGADLAEQCGFGFALALSPAEPPIESEVEAAPGGGDDGRGLAVVEVQCLGDLVVRRGSEVVDLSSLRPRSRALLAVLALHYPRSVHTEILVESLWPDADPSAANHRLQTAVSSLRRVLSTTQPDGSRSTVLHRLGEAYRLSIDSTDVARLLAREGDAQRARQSGDAAAEIQAWRDVVRLYHSELLGEFGPAEWVLRERERLCRIAVDATERLAEFALAQGDPSGSLVSSRRGLDLDRYRESLWRLAVIAAEATDDQALATSLRNGRQSALAELGL
jgi:DNA-binding SARP family transcriptional activator